MSAEEEALAHRDPLTGLTNRRGWDLLVADAQHRVDASGDLVAVAVFDIDGLNGVTSPGAGNELLRRAADALKAVSGSRDRLARYGDSEFAVMSNNVADDELPAHFGIFFDAMAAHGVEASMGFAAAGPGISVVDALTRAVDERA